MSPKAELAELVDDHLSRNSNAANVALASAIAGLASIFSAYQDAQSKRGNWGGMLANLRKGEELLRPVLPVLRREGGAGVATIVAVGERELGFAAMMADEIVRLQAGESTLL